MSTALKIAVIGPSQGGKSILANHISRIDFPEQDKDHKYDPTVGVRILKFVLEAETTAEIELWDCSGDQEYEDCWPAILKDLHGIVAVFNGNSQDQYHSAKIWAEWFATNAGLGNGQAVMFAITTDASQRWAPHSFVSGDVTVNVPVVRVSTEITTDASGNTTTFARSSFNAFVRTVERALIERGH